MSLNKIESLKKLKKKGMYEITINGIDYKITEDLIVENILTKGKELTDLELDELKDQIVNDNLLVKVYNYISYQFRSEKEIIKYLEELNATDTQINDIVNKLKMLNMIDDDNLSKSILNYIIAQLKGPKAYKQKLYERKIDIIHSYDDETQLETINKSIEKNKDKNTKYPIIKQKNLLVQKLLRDGFEEKYVFREVDKIEFVDDSDDKLEKEVEKLKLKYSKYSKYEMKNKIINNLMSKGFSYSKIKKYITDEKID